MKLVVILAITGLVFVGSVLSQQQSTMLNAAPPTPTPPTPNNSCIATTTKPKPASQSHFFGTCLVVKFAAYYALGPNQYVELKNGSVIGSPASKCEVIAPDGTETEHPKITIRFECGDVEINIGKNPTHVFVSAINGRYLSNGTFVHNSKTGMFATAVDHHYQCNSEQAIHDSTDNSTSLVLSDFAYEAYRSATGTEFYKVTEECAQDTSQVSDLVRIGVGVCLVALVALVLVAYFVGRRRWAERSSYESV